MKKIWTFVGLAFFILHPQPSFSIHQKINPKCAAKELVFELLNKIIRSDFPRSQINILYHGKNPSTSPPNRPCKDVEQIFQNEGQLPMRSAITVSSNIFKEEQLLRLKRQNDTFVGENFHFHQLSQWTEVNLVFLYTLDDLNSLVSSLVFKRINSYNFIVEQENLVEDLSRPNLLMLPAINRLKFKINLNWDPDSKELVAESTCFYCDEGYPEVVQVWRATQRQLAGKSNLAPLALPSRSDLFKDYTRDFNGKTLRVSMSLGIPTMMNFKVLKNGRMVATSGFQTSLFHLVRRKLNFSYKLKLEHVFGLEGPNGTFTGMVGAVQTGRSDLGMGAAVTFGRHRVVHYLTPNTFHIVTFITRSSILLPDWQTIFRAFTQPLWFSLFLITTFVMLPVYVTVGVLGRSSSSAADSTLGAIVSNGISFIFRPLMDQHRVLSSNSSIRTLNVFWLFSVLVICAEFRSNLITLFLQPPMESLPTTFTQLANSDYAIYTHYAGGSLEDIVRGTHTKTFDKINEKMILEESIQKCLKVTMTQKAACISYEDDAIIEGERYFSDPYGHSFIHRAPIAAFNFFASIILPKEAVYIDAMEQTVGQIVDMGISKRFHDEQHHWTKRKGMSLARKRRHKLPIFYDSHHHFAKLNLGHFSAAFTVLFLGVLAANITWIFEQRETDNFKKMLEYIVQQVSKVSWPWHLQVGRLKRNRVEPIPSETSSSSTRLVVRSAAVESTELVVRELVSD